MAKEKLDQLVKSPVVLKPSLLLPPHVRIRKRLRQLVKSGANNSYDLFRLLPKEIAFHLFSYLEPVDIIALLAASVLIRRPRIMLQHPVERLSFFSPPTKVITLPIPSKPNPFPDVLRDAYVSQLRDGRLIYCYSDGTLGLFSSESPTTDPIFCQPSETLLPECNAVAVHELPEKRLVICYSNQQTYLFDLKTKKSMLQNIPVATLCKESYDFESDTFESKPENISMATVCSMLAIDSDSAFFGMEDGRFIHWSFKANEALSTWQFSAKEINPNHPENVYLPNVDLVTTIDQVNPKGLAILCIARNIDGQLFMLFDLEDGYSVCLFDINTLRVECIKFIEYDGINKTGDDIHRVFYNRFGDVTLVLKRALTSTSLKVCDLRATPKVRAIPQGDDLAESAFSFANGHIVFSCYKDDYYTKVLDSKSGESTNVQFCQLRIQCYDTPQVTLDNTPLNVGMK